MAPLFIKHFFTTYVLLLVFDFIWLGVIMRNFYQKEFAGKVAIINGSIVVNWPVALATWALLAFALVLFVIQHAWATTIYKQVLLGALLGLAIYGIYNGTNYALLNDWSAQLAIADTVWGVFVCALVSFIVYFV